jgi:polyhydroxybutyrate depolymerase
MLHGGYGSGAQAEHAYGWDAEGASGHFLVAYPDGLDHAWNTDGGCCGKPATDNVNDVAFISAMVKTIEREVSINRKRVYATGISNGGILTYTLACKTNLFAAIGPDSATEVASCPSPKPLSVIHIHGAADPVIPYNGGSGENVGVGSHSLVIDGPSIPSINARWRNIDKCSAPVVSTAGVVTTSIATCPVNRSVELITIAGAGHQWPGAVANPRAERILHTDPPSTALHATQVIWTFFASHPR